MNTLLNDRTIRDLTIMTKVVRAWDAAAAEFKLIWSAPCLMKADLCHSSAPSLYHALIESGENESQIEYILNMVRFSVLPEQLNLTIRHHTS